MSPASGRSEVETCLVNLYIYIYINLPYIYVSKTSYVEDLWTTIYFACYTGSYLFCYMFPSISKEVGLEQCRKHLILLYILLQFYCSVISKFSQSKFNLQS